MDNPYLFLPNLVEQITEIQPDSIISRTIYQDANIKAILFGFSTGQELSEHTASTPAIIHILDGEASVILGKDEFQVSSVAWMHLTPHLSHSIYAKTPVRMLLLLIRRYD